MNNLLEIREKVNLTQEELAEKSGISVRTIQRIEAGTEPKGHTLVALSKALEVGENELLDKVSQTNNLNYTLIKVINISSLPFSVVPIANVVIPLFIMFITKQFNPLTKQIVSVQILWLISSVIIFMLFVLIIENDFSLIIMILAVLSNVFIIIRNAAEIDRNKQLYIKLKFSII